MTRLTSLSGVAERMNASVVMWRCRIKESGLRLPRPGHTVMFTEDHYRQDAMLFSRARRQHFRTRSPAGVELSPCTTDLTDQLLADLRAN
jgi:hypothetical protein